jgi:CRISPR-associated protein Csx10
MWLKIRPREPLLLGEARADTQFIASRSYIPGRALRGALALDLLREGRSGDEVVAFAGRLRLGNFFPAPEWGRLQYALPLPMTAMSCKRHSGFLSSPCPDRRGHGVVDSLIPHLAYHLLLQQENPACFPVPFAFDCDHEGCGGRMEPFVRFYCLTEVGRETLYLAVEPRFHAQTKVALSRSRRASYEEMLYTVSALAPKTESPDGSGDCDLVFLGRVQGEGEAVARLREALERTPIGALHTRGYGAVQVEEAEVGLPPLADRLSAFNQKLKRVWDDLRRLAVNADDLREGPEHTYFSVDLLAPAVFRQDGVPTLVPRLQVGGRVLEPVLWATRPDMASGWSGAWGLPKPTDLAARQGSVYVFRWPGTEEEALPFLAALEEEGVGERRDESFGECLVCHPFHQEVEER